MTQAKITLYLDVISPFAYIAYYLLRVSPHEPTTKTHSSQ